MANCLSCCLVALPSCTSCTRGCLPMLNSSAIRSTPCQNVCMSIRNPPLGKELILAHVQDLCAPAVHPSTALRVACPEPVEGLRANGICFASARILYMSLDFHICPSGLIRHTGGQPGHDLLRCECQRFRHHAERHPAEIHQTQHPLHPKAR